MSELLPADRTRELIAQFANRRSFEGAVERLLAAGFDRTDLSVLATHDSLEVAGDIAGYKRDPAEAIKAGFVSELGWLGPMATAGVLLVAAGPAGAAAAAIIGAAAGALALNPLLGQLTETVHAPGFARAIEEGRILLWVRTSDARAVERAGTLLASAGGSGICRLAQPAQEADETAGI